MNKKTFFLIFILMQGCTKSAPSSSLGPGDPGGNFVKSETSFIVKTPKEAEVKAPIALSGGWESSGGDGVICSHGKVHVLDYFEWMISDGEVLPFYKDLQVFYDVPIRINHSLLEEQNPDKVLDEVIRLLRRMLPTLADKIDILRERYPFSSWVKRSKVEDVFDSRPVKNLEQCKLVQLANRKSASKGVEKIPDFFIEYNQPLVEKLSVVEKAVLILHEYLYILAKELGHKNSQQIREIVAYSFSFGLKVMSEAPESLAGVSIKERVSAIRLSYGLPFGDYMRFFSDGFLQNTNEASLYKAFVSATNKLRLYLDKCEGDMKSVCDEQKAERTVALISHPTAQQSLTNAEGFSIYGWFIYQSYYHLSGHFSLLFTKEKFLVDEFDLTKKELKEQICEAVYVQQLNQKFHVLKKKAKNYCDLEFGFDFDKIKKRDQLFCFCYLEKREQSFLEKTQMDLVFLYKKTIDPALGLSSRNQIGQRAKFQCEKMVGDEAFLDPKECKTPYELREEFRHEKATKEKRQKFLETLLSPSESEI